MIQIGGEGVEAGRRGGGRDERQPGSVGPVQFRPEGQGKPQVVLSRRKERSQRDFEKRHSLAVTWNVKNKDRGWKRGCS